MSDGLAEKLARIGIDDTKAQQLLKNEKLARVIADVAAEAGFPANRAAQLQNLAQASRGASPQAIANRKLVSEAIADGRISSQAQIDEAMRYLSTTATPTSSELDKVCGVGVVVSEEDVLKEVHAYITKNSAELEKQRYRALGPTMAAIKKLPALKWANPALLKPAVDSEFLKLLGPKDERDQLGAKGAAAKAAKAAKTSSGGKSAKPEVKEVKHNMFEEGFLGALHKPGENKQESEELRQQHLKATGGRVFTRFPPEPNGHLHIGHAKAIALNFGYAAYHNGECYLRFDDTNPETEDAEFSRSIEEIVEWLGFTPYKVTWSSDYFHKLYDLAEQLILNGYAYVCFCTPEEVKKHRGQLEDGTPGGERTPCVHRSQSPEESLQLFRNMRDGKYQRGEATLRMRQDLSSPNPQMWDLVAYRVLDAPHHRTGTEWRIYPTYDFTHCLVDSFENISHSLCSMEFRMSRESYEWLCDMLKVYKPAQREFGRLNLQSSVMSKRKLLQLVEKGYVSGWDDPRLFTLVALRRRGVPPGAILSFVNELGVTTATSVIEAARFEASVRKYLENSVPRLMMVLDPVKVTLTNLKSDHLELIDVPFKPGTPEMGSHKVPFTNTLYIDRSDFREHANKNFFRLTLDQPVGLLRIPHVIVAKSFKTAADGQVVEIEAEYDVEGKLGKPKTFIQWVPESKEYGSPVHIKEVREFSNLFKSANPGANPDGFLADVNKDSLHVYKSAVVDPGFWEVKERSPWEVKTSSKEEEVLRGNDKKGAPEAVRFQALRVGYYCMDRSSTANDIVLNRIVTLKEDRDKE